MDSGPGLVIDQREWKPSYRDFLLDVGDSSEREFSSVLTNTEPKAPESQRRPFCINVREESQHPGLVPVCPAPTLWDRGTDGGGEKDGAVENHLLHTVSPTESAIEEPRSPLAGYWVHLNDNYNAFESTLTGHTHLVTSSPIRSTPWDYTEGGTSLCCPTRDQASVGHSPSACGHLSGCDLVAVNAAAHLQLVGESLALIGHQLQETDKVVGCSSLLLDSMLCALVPLLSLTSLTPPFRGAPQHTLADAMENIAFMMPGL